MGVAGGRSSTRGRAGLSPSGSIGTMAIRSRGPIEAGSDTSCRGRAAGLSPALGA